MGEYDLNYYRTEAGRLAVEIQRKLVILGIDWTSERDMRDLASRVLAKQKSSGDGDTHRATAWAELFGMIGLMNTVMAESANRNVEVHGDECWKAIARALWAAKGSGDR